MATETWIGDGEEDWGTATDWSGGFVPEASTAVAISSPAPEVTLNTGPATANSVNISGNGGLVLLGDSSLSVTAGVSNGGRLVLHPGGTLTIADTLTNTGTIVFFAQEFGETPGLASITTAQLANTDDLGHAGSVTISGVDRTDEPMALIVDGVATFDPLHPGTAVGDIALSGHALIQFASGSITSIAQDGSIELDGDNAFIAISGDTESNSALIMLSSNDGLLVLRDDASLSLSGDLVNSGKIGIDPSTDTGANFSVGGTLTNTGSLTIGQTGVVLNALANTDDRGHDGAIGLKGSSLIVGATAGLGHGLISTHPDPC